MRRVILIGIAALLTGLVLVPLGLLLLQAGDVGAALTEGTALGNTVLLCAGVLGLTWLIGVPLGFAQARYTLPGWLGAACTLPYVVPPYVTTIAWIQLANPTNGWLSGALPLNIYSLVGMIWVLGLHLTPFLSLSVRDALLRLNPALEEAARISGARPWQIITRVTLPLLAPALLAGSGFVISATAASFGVPYLLSAPAATPTPTLTTRIYQALELSPVEGRPRAITLALVLLLVGVALPALLRAISGRRRYDSAAPPRPPAPIRSPLVTALVFVYVALAALLPLVSIAATSVMKTFGGGISPENLTIAHYVSVLGDARTADALLRSVGLAAGAATATVLVGALLAHGAEREATPFTRAMATLGRAPYAIPGSVLALGMLLAFSQEIRVILLERVSLILALADTVWLLGIAYTVKFLALPVDGLRAALRTVHPSLEEAGRIAGAPWGTVLTRITLPLLRPAMITAWLLVFIPCFCEVTLSVLLRGPRTEVLGTRLFYLQSYADPASAAVLAMVIVGVLAIGAGLKRLF